MKVERVFLGLAVLSLAGLAGAKVFAVMQPGPPAALLRSPMDPLLKSGPAPEVSGYDRAGVLRGLGDLRGRHVLLNLWFSDCEPCRDEMPSLDALAKQLAGRVEVVALSVDPSWEKVDGFHQSDPTLRGKVPAYKLWLDAKKLTPPRYGSFKFPETFLISPAGELLARFVGPRDWASPQAVAMLRGLVQP